MTRSQFDRILLPADGGAACAIDVFGAPTRLQDVPVLIVEPERGAATSSYTELEHEGCSVRLASSAEQALEVLGFFTPRAIVLDLVLPRMSGLVLASVIRSSRPAIPIVALTAFEGPETAHMALGAGCARVLLRSSVGTGGLASTLIECLTQKSASTQ